MYEVYIKKMYVYLLHTLYPCNNIPLYCTQPTALCMMSIATHTLSSIYSLSSKQVILPYTCTYTHGHRKHFYSGEAIGDINIYHAMCKWCAIYGGPGTCLSKEFWNLRLNLVQFKEYQLVICDSFTTYDVAPSKLRCVDQGEIMLLGVGIMSTG